MRFRDGVVTALVDAPDAGSLDDLSSLEAAWLATGGPQASGTVVFHGASPERAEELCERLGGLAEIVSFSPALALQMGVGCVGAAWTRKA
jgi:hypothetical protein